MPDDLSDKNLEEKVIGDFSKIQVSVASSYIEACDRNGKRRNLTEKYLYGLLTIFRMVCKRGEDGGGGRGGGLGGKEGRRGCKAVFFL